MRGLEVDNGLAAGAGARGIEIEFAVCGGAD
jgi:hypothetical protein